MKRLPLLASQPNQNHVSPKKLSSRWNKEDPKGTGINIPCKSTVLLANCFTEWQRVHQEPWPQEDVSGCRKATEPWATLIKPMLRPGGVLIWGSHELGTFRCFLTLVNRDVAEQHQGSESGSVGMEGSGFECTSPASTRLVTQVGLFTTILNSYMLRAWESGKREGMAWDNGHQRMANFLELGRMPGHNVVVRGCWGTVENGANIRNFNSTQRPPKYRSTEDSP